MKTYKCRSKRSGEEAQIEAHSPEDAAEIFAEEWGLEDGDIAHVLRHGKFRVYLEAISHVTKI